MFTLLTIGVLLVAGLMFFALVVAMLKLVLFLVFLPLRLAFHLVLVPVRLAIALVMVPVFLVVAAVCGIGAFLALFVPLLPFAIIVGAVWLMVKRGRTARAV